MKKVLSLAILLLNLFVANNVHAQSYSSELGVGDLIKKAWDNAQNSNADIYAELYDGNYSDIRDYYSQYGNFTYDVVSGYDLTPYEISPQGSSSTGASSSTQNSGSLPVGFYYSYDPPSVNNNWILNQPYQAPDGAKMCREIPLYSMYRQNLKYECVACAAGTMAVLMGAGNSVSGYKDFETVYCDISDYASGLGIDFATQSLNCTSYEYYKILTDVAGLNLYMANSSIVPIYIDNGSAVLGVRSTCSNCVSLIPDTHHMVTIVGYDANNYYCIDPVYLVPQAYPISEFQPDFFYGYVWW